MPCPDPETILTFFDGRLDPEAHAAVADHAEGCASCRAVLVDWARDDATASPGGDSAAGSSPAVRPGTTLEHFVVLDLLGTGGMGMVVSAHDTRLDRKVAIKLLRPDRASGGAAEERRARLLREAQALAKLTHPNVITVYEVGAFGEHVFIAMELVAGGTLADWLRATKRSWREVVVMFLKVGAGLSAAHAAGLVHRDFKPDNVLVGDDGRVRVTDFGLVGNAGEAAATGPSPSPDALSLTRTGALLGTPQYMAPEQHERASVDGRADQFAFCVALHAALYGEPPFVGRGYDELSASVRAGTVRPPPSDARVPAWLRRCVLRGLSRAPDARFPSMDALLAELGRVRGHLGRGLVVAGVVVTLLVAAAVTSLLLVERRGASCRGGERRLAGIWDAPTRTAIRSAFLGTAKPYAEAAWTRVATELDRYAAAWTGKHRAACEATRDGEQSARALDLRMGCLTQRLAAVGALSRVFASGDATVVANAAAAAGALPPLAGCDDLERLALRAPPAESPRARIALADARRQLADAQARHDAGKDTAALPGVLAAQTVASVWKDVPLGAAALLLLGRVQIRLGDRTAAEGALFAAAVAATEAGDLEAEADAHIELVGVSILLARPEAGWRSARLGAALLARLDDPDRRARLLGYEGSLLAAQNQFPEARARFLAELALEKQAHPGPHAHVGEAFANLALADYNQSAYASAIANLRLAIAAFETSLGPLHPQVAKAHTNLGVVYSALGRFDDALDEHRRALHIQEGELGPRHHAVAYTVGNIADEQLHLRHFAEAMTDYRRAIAIAEATTPTHELLAQYYVGLGTALMELGRDSEAGELFVKAAAVQETTWGREDPMMAAVFEGQGSLLVREKRYAEAAEAYRRALAIYEKAQEPASESIAMVLEGLSDAELGLAHPAQALAHRRRSRGIFETTLAADHPAVVRSYVGLADLLATTGSRVEAVAAYVHAIALLSGRPSPRLLAQARLGLGRALWDGGRDRAAALALVHAAASDVAAGGPEVADVREEVGRWLGGHAR